MEDYGCGDAFLFRLSDQPVSAQNTSKETDLVEVRSLLSLQTGSHTPSTVSGLRNIPYSVHHRIEDEVIVRRGELQAGREKDLSVIFRVSTAYMSTHQALTR